MSRVKANSVDFDNSCVALMRRLILNMRTLKKKLFCKSTLFSQMFKKVILATTIGVVKPCVD